VTSCDIVCRTPYRTYCSQVQYVVGAGDMDSGEVPVQMQPGAGEGPEASDSSSSVDAEPYDPQSVTVPVTLCLAIMVG
jgi:hypothetical protein